MLIVGHVVTLHLVVLVGHGVTLPLLLVMGQSVTFYLFTVANLYLRTSYIRGRKRELYFAFLPPPPVVVNLITWKKTRHNSWQGRIKVRKESLY